MLLIYELFILNIYFVKSGIKIGRNVSSGGILMVRKI